MKGKVFQLRGGFVLARFGGEQDNRRASGGNFPATRGDEMGWALATRKS